MRACACIIWHSAVTDKTATMKGAQQLRTTSLTEPLCRRKAPMPAVHLVNLLLRVDLVERVQAGVNRALTNSWPFRRADIPTADGLVVRLLAV